MRKGNLVQLNILILAMLLLLLAVPAHAEKEEPITLTVEADPECLLSEAGEMTYFRFTVKNNLDENYTLDELTLQGDLISDKLITEEITILGNDVIEFTLENVRIEEYQFDVDLIFRLTWRTVDFAPEDEGHEQPILTEHMVAAQPIRVEQFVEPVMDISFTPDILMAREGDLVTVTYTLVNETKFDMTNITLQDAGIPQQPFVPLEKNVLNAGERMEVSTYFQMGSGNVELNPSVQYTVRGVESKTTAKEPVTVELVEIDFRMEVEKYTATADGTLFRITLLNNGTHPVTDIRIVDEIGSLIASGINLNNGADRTISYVAPSAVSSGTVRYISFAASGTDGLGGTVTAKSPSAYELLPFVDSDQVRLQLTVTLRNATQTDGGVYKLNLLFEVHNDSQVRIQNAVITESDYLKGVVNEYATLPTGITPYEKKDFIVPSGTRSLTFVLTAMDPAQTQYASAPVTLDLTPLAAPAPTNPPAIRPGKTVDTTGTIYDTSRYTKIFRMAALIALALTLMFLLLSLIFRVAETNTRRWLPKETLLRPFGPRRKPAAPVSAPARKDPVHNQFGYMQPAKLRYMDRTDRLPVLNEESDIGAMVIQTPVTTATKLQPTVSRSVTTPRREGEITAVPIHNAPHRPVMMTFDQTLPFAPVHEQMATQVFGSTPATEPETAPAEAHPREIELGPRPRIVPRQQLEIVRVSAS